MYEVLFKCSMVCSKHFQSITFSLSVTITGAPFKGFFIIAAEEGSKDWPSGTFSSQDPHKGRTVWCSVRNDAATHSNDRWKDAVTLQWWGPSFSPADMIRFV